MKLGVSEEIAEKCESASAEELKGYIPKARFNEVNEENKSLRSAVEERDNQLSELKKFSGDNEALKKQIEELQNANAEQNKAHEAEIAQLKLDNAVDSALATAGAKNGKAVRALLNFENIKLGSDGKLSGLSEQLEEVRKSDGYLFAEKDDPRPQNFTGFNPGASNDGTPKADADFSQMTYSQMVAYAEKNPSVKFE